MALHHPLTELLALCGSKGLAHIELVADGGLFHREL
jgi:hypothetical protein